jgi:hypothetical protein
MSCSEKSSNNPGLKTMFELAAKRKSPQKLTSFAIFSSNGTFTRF